MNAGAQASAAVSEWEARGAHLQLAGYRVFTLDIPPRGPQRKEPLLVLHGFPTCSFDFHLIVEGLARERRVLLLDFVGFGLSEKPDREYTVGLQADVATAYTAHLGIETLSLLTHDIGDTIGGELLARQREGAWPVQVASRVVTNGSIYIGMAQLSAGQRLLLDMPDQRAPKDAPINAEGFAAGIAATFSPRAQVDDAELAAQWVLAAREEGHLLMPRVIRYIEERRRSERRFTGAIETHPSPLSVVWGADDPIAVVDMSERLISARPGTPRHVLQGVGHYPMLEAPDRFLAAVLHSLA